MLEAGEDPLYIARRMVRMASEDIGLADNAALPLVRSRLVPWMMNGCANVFFKGHVSIPCM